MSFNLLKNIENINISPIMLLTGAEAFLRRKFRENWIDRSLGDSLKDLNYSNYIAGSDDITLALQSCRDYPCFAPKRAVWIAELARLRKAEAEALMEYLGSPQETTLLILESEKLDGRLDWVKRLKKHSQWIEVEPLGTEEAVAWLRDCFQKEGKKLGDELLLKIVAWTGTGMDALELLAQQLSLYVGERDEITPRDLDGLLVKVTEEDVFAVIDAMFSNRKTDLMHSLTALLDSGEAPLKILALIYRHLSILLSLQKAGGAKTASLFRISPYILRNYEGQLRRFASRLSPSLLGPIAQADFQLKSSALPKDLLLKVCVQEIGRLLG